MNELFQICVDILKWIGDITGLGYEAANIWIFVIIHPVLTLIAIGLWLRAKSKNQKL